MSLEPDPGTESTVSAGSDRPPPATGSTSLSNLPIEWRAVSPVRGMCDTALVWICITGVWYGAIRFPHPATYAAAFLLLGALQNHISSLLHHGLHWNLHPRRRINDWICRLFLAGPQGQLLGGFRQEHLGHHNRLGAEDDPERVYYDLYRQGRSSPFKFLFWLLTLFLGWVALPFVRRFLTGHRDARAPQRHERRDSLGSRLTDIGCVLVVQGAIFGGLWLASGTAWAYLALWFLPLITLGAGLSVLRATIEHLNVEHPDRLLMSFASNPLERFFVSPFKFNYHYEHHRFITIPYYHTPKVHKLLRERGDYEEAILASSYFGRLREDIRQLARKR